MFEYKISTTDFCYTFKPFKYARRLIFEYNKNN